MRCGRPTSPACNGGVSPLEAMELARHSDMRLTMKTYTDAAQLPLAKQDTFAGLPSLADSQIDSRTLVADRQAVSPAVIGMKAIKVGKTIENIDESHRRRHRIVAISHLKSQNGGERGIRTPLSPPIKGNLHDDSRIDSRNSIPSCPDLSQVVTAWAKLPAPLKAAILAIVKRRNDFPPTTWL